MGGRGDWRRAAEAARLLSCFEGLAEEQEAVFEVWVTRMNNVTLEMVREQLDQAGIAEAWKQGGALTADAAVALALRALRFEPRRRIDSDLGR